MTASNGLHHSATTGFHDAKAYDAHRPSYPPEAGQKLLEHLGLEGKHGGRIVDLAAGTGKFTELLAAREEKYEIIAVEPHETMRQTLAAKGLDGVMVREGKASDMDVEDEWADAVITAQAFHWFATDEALQEIHRVLKPGGKLAMIWNVEHYNKPLAWPAATKWEQSLNELINGRPMDGQPRFRDYEWMKVFDKGTPLFSTPVADDKTTWTVRLDIEGVWDRLRTLSHVAMLEGEAKDVFRAKFDAILDAHDGRSNERGELELHGMTVFFWTQRL